MYKRQGLALADLVTDIVFIICWLLGGWALADLVTDIVLIVCWPLRGLAPEFYRRINQRHPSTNFPSTKKCTLTYFTEILIRCDTFISPFYSLITLPCDKVGTYRFSNTSCDRRNEMPDHIATSTKSQTMKCPTACYERTSNSRAHDGADYVTADTKCIFALQMWRELITWYA